MYGQGSRQYDQQFRREQQYSASDGGWYDVGPRYMATNGGTNYSDRPYHQHGVDGRPVRKGGSDIGVVPSGRLPPPAMKPPNSPVYDLEHLATFSAAGGPGPGQLMSIPNGISRIRDMARAGSIWPLRVKIVISERALTVSDARTGEDMEHFPMSLVSSPTSAMANNQRVTIGNEPLDNMVIFIVLEDPVTKASPPEMHIFHCIGRSGQDFVDDVLAAKSGKIPAVPYSQEPVYAHKYGATAVHEDMLNAERAAIAASRYKGGPQAGNVFRQSMRRDGWQLGSGAAPASKSKEAAQRGLTLLDRCFSDIEQFVLRIQQAANAFRELDNRKSVRINKNSQQLGDGLLGMRARPPPAKDFIEILQKFKLSFILLANLKLHIRDPNAPELVHFLITPLTLVVDASSGGNSSSDLASRVVAPLQTPESHELLDNCLTSRESEFLSSLGPAWTTSIDQWRWEIPPYNVKFYDGWQPPAFWLEEIGIPVGTEAASRQQGLVTKPTGSAIGERSIHGYAINHDARNFELQRKLAQEYQRNRLSDILSSAMEKVDPFERQIEKSQVGRVQSPAWDPRTAGSAAVPEADAVRRYPQPPSEPDYGYFGERVTPRGSADNKVQGQKFVDHYGNDSNFVLQKSSKSSQPSGVVTNNQMDAQKSGAGRKHSGESPKTSKVPKPNVFKVTSDRESKNHKELSVRAGELVEVLDDQKNWWKVSNVAGQTGYVPKTILIPYLSSK